MQQIIKKLIIIIFICSSALSAIQNDNMISSEQSKIYVNSNELEITNEAIYIHLENHTLVTNVLRQDETGLYIFENDMVHAKAAWGNKNGNVHTVIDGGH